MTAVKKNAQKRSTRSQHERRVEGVRSHKRTSAKQVKLSKLRRFRTTEDVPPIGAGDGNGRTGN
jgi:hypothetical protein